MYTFESTVRYSETDADGKLNCYKIIDFFQDCSILQADSLGIGTDYLFPRGLAWVLSTWNIELYRCPKRGEQIITGTSPYDVKGFLGKRNFLMTTAAGEVLSVADSLWTMLDLHTGKPIRVPEEVIRRYELNEKLPMTYLRSRIVIPETLTPCETTLVTNGLLDENRHVNNSRYVSIALDCIKTHDYHRIRVEYHSQARAGDLLLPKVGRNDDGTVVVIASNNEERCCVIQFEE